MELQDGWLSRCLVFHSAYDAPKKRGRVEAEVPDHIAERVNRWYKREILPINDGHSVSPFTSKDGSAPAPPLQIVVPTDEDANELFFAFDEEAIAYGRKHEELACLWKKTEENARRIALILACSESYDAPRITRAMADYACRLVRYLMMDFSATIAPEIVSGEVALQKRRIIKVIEKSGVTGVTKTNLSRSTPEMRKENRDKLLVDLIESGEILAKGINRGNGITLHYWTSENYAKLSESE
jgi:hypothetical protein